MIYTVTLNPSIDYVIKLDNLNYGIVNRANEENIYPGGKGINVSNILNELGYKITHSSDQRDGDYYLIEW